MFGARISQRSLNLVNHLARVLNEDHSVMTMPQVPAELIEAVNELDEIRRITDPLKNATENWLR